MARISVLVLSLLGLPSPCRGDHLQFDLRVKSGKASKSATQDITAPGATPKERPVLETRVNAPLQVTWTITSSAKSPAVKDVVVHFFVVKIDKAGQSVIPKLDKDVPVETALTMDFKPKDKTEGELTFRVEQPGIYLLRLETIGAAVGLDGHEHFAALDLVIK